MASEFSITGIAVQVARKHPGIEADLHQRLVLYHMNSPELLDALGRRFRPWVMEDMPNVESLSRACRNARAEVRNGGKTIKSRKDKPSVDREFEVPTWYTSYLQTTWWSAMKEVAYDHWKIDWCILNGAHPLEHWHHNKYDNLGTIHEQFSLVPMCAKCHLSNRLRGPRLPDKCPATVEHILRKEGLWNDDLR